VQSRNNLPAAKEPLHPRLQARLWLALREKVCDWPVLTDYVRYKQDPAGTLQYGLVAEEVAKVYPELVTYGMDGKVETVRYLTFISMLLNELQKQAKNNELLAAQMIAMRASTHRVVFQSGVALSSGGATPWTPWDSAGRGGGRGNGSRLLLKSRDIGPHPPLTRSTARRRTALAG
jgi:hypothetical protein